MTSIYNQAVMMADRAKMLYLSAEQPHSDIPAIAKTIDVLLLKMGGMDGTNATIYEESGFKIRVDQAAQASLPVIAQFNLSARYYLDKQMSLNSVLNLPADSNQALIKIIQILRTDTWTFDTLDAKTGWRPVQALALSLTDYHTGGEDITDVWQSAVLQSVLYPLQALMNQGKFPKMPVIVVTFPAFLTKYSNNLLNFLYNRRAEISIGLHQWLYDATPGPYCWEGLQQLFDLYRPSDTFKFAATPYGYQGELGDGHVVFHIFTAGRFSVPEVTDAEGKPARVTCGLWCDTKEALYKFLDFGQKPPPAEPPPSTKLEQKVATLETQVAALQASVAALEAEAIKESSQLRQLVTDIVTQLLKYG